MTPDRGEEVLRAGRASTMIAEQFSKTPVRSVGAVFDADPGGRKGIAKGHTVSRNVENPNDVFVRTEYDSVEDAKKVRQQLLDSGALSNFTVKTPPTIIEIADQATY